MTGSSLVAVIDELEGRRVDAANGFFDGEDPRRNRVPEGHLLGMNPAQAADAALPRGCLPKDFHRAVPLGQSVEEIQDMLLEVRKPLEEVTAEGGGFTRPCGFRSRGHLPRKTLDREFAHLEL